jgi:hypothetical protein
LGTQIIRAETPKGGFKNLDILISMKKIILKIKLKKLLLTEMSFLIFNLKIFVILRKNKMGINSKKLK